MVSSGAVVEGDESTVVTGAGDVEGAAVVDDESPSPVQAASMATASRLAVSAVVDRRLVVADMEAPFPFAKNVPISSATARMIGVVAVTLRG